MKRPPLFSTLCCCVITFFTTSSNAAFFDRGGGLIYDSDQDLTWTKDAGLSGFVNWHEATEWVANLRLGDVGGWRLPHTTQFSDPTCGIDLRGTEVQDPYEHRRDCLGGEMEQLTVTAGPYDYFTNTLGGTNGELFVNLYRKRYWSATPYRDGIDPCIYYPDDYDAPCRNEDDNGIRTDFYWQWGFGNLNGIGGGAYKTTMRGTADRYAWAVHDGDVGAVSIPTPEIRVNDSAAPAADLQMPFGNVIEMTSSDGTVTVTNDGDQDLVIGQIAVTDPLAAPFSIQNDACSNKTLTQDMSCNLTVRYSPPVTGTSIDSFSIPSNDADEDPVIFTVSGTGVSASAPEITVTDSVNPAGDLQVLFGEVTEATTSDQTVRISNDGGANLDIGHIAVADPLAIPFRILNDNCSNQTLIPAADCVLTVRFAPPSPGASSDSFDVPSSDGDENPVTVNVSGTGTAIQPLDSNDDGILDADAVAIGLDPNDPDGDSDNDGQTDVIEVGADIENPMDNDGDGIIDALEPGVTASNAEVASGLRLVSGDTVIITTAAGEMLSNVSADDAVDGPGGLEFPFGTISYLTSAPPGGSVTVRMTFSADLPDTLVINKVDRNDNHTTLPDTVWNQVDDRSVDITLTDGDPQTDLDKAVNGSIEDPVAIGNAVNAGGGGGGGGGSGGGGGGCTIGAAAKMDPTWLLILLAAGIRYLQRHGTKLKKVA